MNDLLNYLANNKYWLFALILIVGIAVRMSLDTIIPALTRKYVKPQKTGSLTEIKYRKHLNSSDYVDVEINYSGKSFLKKYINGKVSEQKELEISDEIKKELNDITSKYNLEELKNMPFSEDQEERDKSLFLAYGNVVSFPILSKQKLNAEGEDLFRKIGAILDEHFN